MFTFPAGVFGKGAGGGGGGVPTDGPNGWKFPVTAAQWTTLGALAAPSSLYIPNNIVSGDLLDTIGSVNLVANASPGYQTTVSGWTHKAVSFNQTANQRFAAASGVGPNPATTAQFWMGWFRLATPLATRGVMGCAGSAAFNTFGILHNTSDNLTINYGVVSGTDSTTKPGTDGTVHIVSMQLKVSTAALTMYTEEAKTASLILGTLADGIKGIGGVLNSSTTSFSGDCLLLARWDGVEWSDAQIKTLYQNIGATIPW